MMLVSVGARASCIDDAGERYRVDPILLKSIAWEESRGHANAVGPKLADGNVALGLMQINTNHLPELAPYGIDRQRLFDACTSAHLGAWVLANCIKTFGAVWKAVGCYAAGPKSKNTAAQMAYVRDVQRIYGKFKKQENLTPKVKVKAPVSATNKQASKESQPAAPTHKMVVWNAYE